MMLRDVESMIADIKRLAANARVDREFFSQSGKQVDAMACAIRERAIADVLEIVDRHKGK